MSLDDTAKENGIYYFGNENGLEEKHIKPVIQWIHNMNALPDHEKPPTLELYIFCNGGTSWAARALGSTIMTSKIPVNTIGLGCLISAGLFIFLAGKKRYIHENTSILCHQSKHYISSRTDEVQDAVKGINQSRSSQVKYYMNRTGQSKKVVEEELLGPREWYMSEQEAVKYGIAHEIIDPYKE